MDSQEQDSVVHVEAPQAADAVVRAGGPPAWVDAVLARFRPSDHHVSDEDVFAIVNGESDGAAAADVCAAKAITVPMYCLWRVKYRHLTFDELRKSRRREVWRGRGLLGVVAAVAVLGSGALVFSVARAAYNMIAVASASSSPAILLPVAKTPFGRPGRVGFSAAVSPSPVHSAAVPPSSAVSPALTPAPARTPEAPPAERRSPADEPAPMAEPGFKIQVAAAESLPEGRAIVGRLASAGYPAYLARAVVSNAEVFRVRIGPFETLSAAEEVTSQLKREGYKSAWIAR